MKLTFWTALWVFLADQASKYFVIHILDLEHTSPIDVFPPYLTFRIAWNTGVNFGIGAGLELRWFWIGLAATIGGIVLYWLKREGGTKWTYMSAGLLIGGAFSNVVDRLLYGSVADFLNMSCCGFENPYAFNVADIAVFAGAIGLVIFTGKPKPKARKSKTS
jgi:signal peptidase II